MTAGSSDWIAWIEKAEHDLLAADLIVGGKEVPWDMVAFHAQQAAEKYLKAFLVLKDSQPPKIHDLPKLLRLCAAFAQEFAGFADDAEFLSPLAVFARYPGDPDEPSREDAARGVEIAKRIRECVKQHLPESDE